MQEPNSGKTHEDSKEYKIPEIERFSGSPIKYPAFMAAIRGLNGRILDILINSPLPKLINELMDVCIDIDNRITSRETFRQKYIPKYDGQGYKPYHNYPSQKYIKDWEISNNHEQHFSNSQDGTPMDIDSHRIRPRGPITLEERSRRLNNGLCLYCASDKHIVRDSPGDTSEESNCESDSISSSDSEEQYHSADSESEDTEKVESVVIKTPDDEPEISFTRAESQSKICTYEPATTVIETENEEAATLSPEYLGFKEVFNKAKA
ncbi:hypothetical protein AYI69_g11282 [Smittium culicis]|uniref:Uncharacterized protein n=1 Tax=Smittium culicis TaxID=133412 RepID=A0A1R1WZU8_9FUNG|nr:hypothetical protein AYI69_g11282 [Smittium culicis]